MVGQKTLKMCVCGLFLSVLVFSATAFETDDSYYGGTGGVIYNYEPYNSYRSNIENTRDKRTLGLILQTFADAIGYDILKRPSTLPAKMAAPAKPAPMAPAKPGLPPPPPPPLPRVPVPKAPAPAPRAPAPAPRAPAPAPRAPAPAPKAPAPAPKAPAPAVPAKPAAPAPAVARLPTAPPLLTETIRKMFNINFNWNKNLQPQVPPAAAPAAPAPPAPKMPPPAPRMPPPAPRMPPPAPKMPPQAPAPAPKVPPPPPPPSAPAPKSPPTKAPPKKYYQELDNNNYQENQDYPEQQAIYYPDDESVNQQQQDNPGYEDPIQVYWQNSPWLKNRIQYNDALPTPQYQEYVTPDGERGYHIHHYHQNANVQHQDQPEEENNNNEAAEEEEQQQHQQQEQQEEEGEAPQQHQQNQEQYPDYEDANGDSTKSYYNQYNQPRGFQPVYSASDSNYQTNYYRPGLPLQIHGIQEDKVLVAWPTPFELAGSEIKKKIVTHDQRGPYYHNVPNEEHQDRLHSSGTENQEYKYEPESYGEYNFYTIPPPTQHEEYKTPEDPKIEEELSDKATVNENNYRKKITNINIDRNTYMH